MKKAKVIARAERLEELARYGAERLDAKGLLPDEIPALVKRILSGPLKLPSS